MLFPKVNPLYVTWLEYKPFAMFVSLLFVAFILLVDVFVDLSM